MKIYADDLGGEDPNAGKKGTPAPDPMSSQAPPEGFNLVSDSMTFGPLYPPNGLVVRKDRNLQRQDNMCDGEDVSDGGGKNREVHISGYIRQRERLILEDVIDAKTPFYLTTLGWDGEVRVDEGEYNGPLGIDPNTGEYVWEYSLDLVSTGKDEYENFHESGIVK